MSIRKITQLLTPTHAQLQRHRLKFIKKKTSSVYDCTVGDAEYVAAILLLS